MTPLDKQEPACVVAVDRREPAISRGDRAESCFAPCVRGTYPKGTPYDARPVIVLPTVEATLSVGDYACAGIETLAAIERKSGPDLLSTLFGSPSQLSALGEQKRNIDRFRAELERARAAGTWLRIVVEAGPGWLYAEAERRAGTYGKSFDPERVQAMLESFDVDLGIATVWPGSKRAAELYVGRVLSRVWSQACGGDGAKKMRARGYQVPWLGTLDAKAKGVM